MSRMSGLVGAAP